MEKMHMNNKKQKKERKKCSRSTARLWVVATSYLYLGVRWKVFCGRCPDLSANSAQTTYLFYIYVHQDVCSSALIFKCLISWRYYYNLSAKSRICLHQYNLHVGLFHRRKKIKSTIHEIKINPIHPGSPDWIGWTQASTCTCAGYMSV